MTHPSWFSSPTVVLAASGESTSASGSRTAANFGLTFRCLWWWLGGAARPSRAEVQVVASPGSELVPSSGALTQPRGGPWRIIDRVARRCSDRFFQHYRLGGPLTIQSFPPRNRIDGGKAGDRQRSEHPAGCPPLALRRNFRFRLRKQAPSRRQRFGDGPPDETAGFDRAPVKTAS